MDGIFVTNRNKEPHTDSYDGEEFSFQPNVRVFIPKDAAVHMLGWNQKDKTEVLVRLGWAMKYDPATKNYAENPLGIKRLANFIFDEAAIVPQSSLAPQIPAAEIA